jgi:DNA-directed RNA polymerase specialized sigma24 family protein
MPEGDRDLLLMRYFDQLSAQEIGDVCSLTENAVNVRIFRAIKRLHQLWSKLYGDPESAP